MPKLTEDFKKMPWQKKEKAGWVYMQGDDPPLVYLKEPIHVVKFGYEVERHDILEKLGTEAWDAKEGPPPAVGAAKPFRVKIGHDTKKYIADFHPRFENYRRLMARHFHELAGAVGARNLDKLRIEINDRMIEAHIQTELKKRMKAGAERKVWTKTFAETHPEAKSEEWRGPWEISATRVVKTGTYYPGTHGSWSMDGEWDQEYPCLVGQQTHVLLLVRHRNFGKMQFFEGFKGFGEAFVVDRKNTYDARQELVAQILMAE